MFSLIAGIVFLGLGANEARHAVVVHLDGERSLARVASVTRGSRHHGATTNLTFTTPAGVGSECSMSGDLGAVGTPVWIRYLPRDPARCTPDAIGRALQTAILHTGFAALMLAGSFALYRRAQRGDVSARRSR
jgi:hypothetical protein